MKLNFLFFIGNSYFKKSKIKNMIFFAGKKNEKKSGNSPQAFCFSSW